MCDTNLAYRGYKGKDQLDDEGNKPCLQCLQELENEELDVSDPELAGGSK